MDILLWVIVGGIAGWLASVIMRTNSSQGLLGDIFLGVLGALIGGFVMNLLGQPGVSGFNLYSLVIAVLGSLVVISVGRMLRHA